MRIKEMYTQLEDFAVPMKKKYGLRNLSFSDKYTSSEPVVFFGFYFNSGLIKLLNQRSGLIVIVWAGSDSSKGNKDYGCINYFKQNKHRVFHIAYSHWIKDDLKHMGLEFIEIPVFPVTFEQFKVEPIGDMVYHYTSSLGFRKPFYGTDTVEAIQKQVGGGHVLSNKFMITNYTSYPREQLHNVYKKCFIGVRLTPHDNMALSCVEMALMGRRSIFNGNIPGAIPYNDASEVFGLIMEEWAYDEPDTLLAEEMREFINLDTEQWLNTKFYD